MKRYQSWFVPREWLWPVRLMPLLVGIAIGIYFYGWAQPVKAVVAGLLMGFGFGLPIIFGTGVREATTDAKNILVPEKAPARQPLAQPAFFSRYKVPKLPTGKSKIDKLGLMLWLPFAATFVYLGFLLIAALLNVMSSTGEAAVGSLGVLIFFVTPLAALEIVLGLIVFFYWPKREVLHPFYLFPAVIFWSVIGIFSFSTFQTRNIAVELRDEMGSLLPNFSVRYHISNRQDSISAMILHPLVANLVDPYSGTKRTGQDGVLHLKAGPFQGVTLSTNSTQVNLGKNSQGYTLSRTWNLWFPKSRIRIVQQLADPLQIVEPRKSVVMVQANVDDQGGMYVSEVQEIVSNIVAGKYTDIRMAPVLQNIAALNSIDEIVKGSRSNPALLGTLRGIASMCQDIAEKLQQTNLKVRFWQYSRKMDPSARETMSERDYDDFVVDVKELREEYLWQLKQGLPSALRY